MFTKFRVTFALVAGLVAGLVVAGELHGQQCGPWGCPPAVMQAPPVGVYENPWLGYYGGFQSPQYQFAYPSPAWSSPAPWQSYGQVQQGYGCNGGSAYARQWNAGLSVGGWRNGRR